MLTSYERNLDAAVKKYQAAITNDALKEMAVKKHGTHLIDPANGQQLESRMQEIRNEAAKTAQAEIDAEMASLRLYLQELDAKKARAEVQVTIGAPIIERYAKLTRISVEDAKAELDQYAATKKSGFDPGKLPDQYSALRNRSTLENGGDISFAYQVYSDEMSKLMPVDDQNTLDRLRHITGIGVWWGIVNYMTGTGWAVSKLLAEGDGKASMDMADISSYTQTAH